MPVTLPSPSAARATLARAVGWDRPVVLGVVGSIVLAVGALGVGYVPPRSRLGAFTATDALRTTTVGEWFSRVCIVVGLLLLLRAWLLVGRRLREAGDDRAPGLTALHRTFWLWAAPLMLVPPLFSQDIYSYTAQGNLLNVGYDPYEFGPASIPGANLEAVSPVWLQTPAPYGPLFLYAGKLSAEVFGGQVYLAALFMRLLAVLGVVLIAVYLPRLARACGVDPALALWAGLLNPLVLMHFVSGAHNDALMVGLVVAGLAYALEGRPIAAIVLVALAGTVKAPALLALGFVGLAWAIRRAGRADPPLRSRVLPWVTSAVLALAVFVGVNRLTGLDFGWVEALDTPGMIHTWLSPLTAVALTVGGALSLVGLDDATDSLLSGLRLVGQAVTLGLVAWWLLRRKPISPALGAAAGLLLLAVLGPVLQPWYALWGLVVLAGAGLGRRGIPYVMAVTCGLVTYSLVHPAATMSPAWRLSDWTCSLAAVAVTVAVLVRDPSTRAEIRQALTRLAPRRSDRTPRATVA